MKIYVWTVPTRVFHALLVLFILGAYLSAESEELLTLHASLGSAVGVLVLYRMIWAVVGPKYSRYCDLPLNIKALKEYLLSIFNPTKEYIGHNPAASFAMVGIIVVIALIAITGLLTYGIQENRGVFAFLHSSLFKEMELFEEVHEFLGVCLWFLIAAHVGGVLLDFLFHKKDETLGSIVNGHKNFKGESASLTLFQKVVAVIGIGLSILVLFYALSGKGNLITTSYSQSIDYKQEHLLFAEECSACHTLYPPTLLPKRSWSIMMSDLENHFGDDASLERKEESSILAYLLENSAESSSSEASLKILASLKNKDIIAITKTPFWEKRHDMIDKTMFKSDKVKSKANCKACHSDVENGTLEDSNIKLPIIRN